MTLITLCPACSTQFFVKEMQLSAHEGKVRCGKCKHVFNASDNLSELTSSEQKKTNENNVDDLHDASSSKVNQVVNIEVNEQTTNSELTTESKQTITEPLVDEVDIGLPVTENLPTSLPGLVEFINRPELPEVEPQQIEDYFAGSSKLKSKSTKKIPRSLLLLLMLLLLILAVGQSIYYFRTAIASQLPQIGRAHV